jgi:IclR family transcriptional regulator, acetate operon repressor
MGTISKALGLIELLRHCGQPLGLTEIARLAGFDKATTRRLLLELALNGYVEQNTESRSYVLGPALQMLGRAREDRFPLYRAVQPVVRSLNEITGETVHATEYCVGALASICIEESPKANRVILDLGQKLPLHATASGFAFLAASPDAFVETIYRKSFELFTPTTPVNRDSLQAIVLATRQRGYSVSNQSLEEGVSSVAAAICIPGGKPSGTIAIAMPSSRMTPDIANHYGALVRRQADVLSAHLFGKPTLQIFRKAS